MENKVTFKQGWKSFWKGYFKFNGQSGRKEFFWGLLIFVIIRMIFSLSITQIMLNNVDVIDGKSRNYLVIGSLILIAILAVLLFIPWLALQTRRLRDTGMPNILCYLLMVLYFISIYLHFFGLLYQIVLFVFMCMPTGKFNKK